MNFEVKGREILIGIAILVVMLIIGGLIGSSISNWQDDRNAEVYKSVRIENDPEMFQYGMRTKVGDSLSYGSLTSVNNVESHYVNGEKSYIRIEHEEYREHERTVTKSSGTGENRKTWTEIEVYWTWDNIGTNYYNCESYNFLGVSIPEAEIVIHAVPSYEGTFDTGYHTRDVVYSLPTKFEGTMRASLDEIICDADFYSGYNIEEAIDKLTSNVWIIVWWVFWIVLTSCALGGFIYLENRWLD